MKNAPFVPRIMIGLHKAASSGATPPPPRVLLLLHSGTVALCITQLYRRIFLLIERFRPRDKEDKLPRLDHSLLGHPVHACSQARLAPAHFLR